jgi:phospholipase/carboxylesterase
MHSKVILTSGKSLAEAGKVMILLHGRGASAEDIISVSQYLQVDEFALLAPQATNHSWYPFSFLSPPQQNEPWLSSALQLVNDIVKDVNDSGVNSEKIFFLGFSQGSCLALEFTARNAKKYGGIIAFTGGLIGDKIYPENYNGDFQFTPVFIGTSDPDPHVPLERVQATSKILRQMNAEVKLKVYKNMGHKINQDEIDVVNKMMLSN